VAKKQIAGLAKVFMFLSAEQTGNGAAQSIAHGLGKTPALVFVVVTDDTGDSTWAVAYGTHTAINCLVTVTNTVKYQVVAIG